MGKGDKRTRKGKICAGSYGNTRKHAARKSVGKSNSTATSPAK